MRKLLNYMKPYYKSVILIIGVLIIQAFCDLALPAYTSDIVNVGIQQGGIDDKIPKVISEEEMDKLSLFLDEEQQEFIHYLYRRDEGRPYEYNGETLTLKSKKVTEDDIEKAADILGKPMLLVEGIEAGKIEIRGQSGEGIFQLIETLPMEQRLQILDKMQKTLDKLPGNMIEQAAVVYIAKVYKEVGLNTNQLQIRYLLVTGIKMLVLSLVVLSSSVMVGFVSARVAAGVGKNLRFKVFKKVVGFSNTEFDHFSTASLITRSTNDIQQIQTLVVTLLRMVLYAPIMAVGGVVKVFHTNVDMSWIIGLAVILIFIVVFFMFRITMPKFKSLQRLVDRLNLVTREILTGLPVIRAFSTEKFEEKRFDGANRDLTKTTLFVNRVMTFMMPMMLLIMRVITVLVVWAGAKGIDQGNMQVGDMMAFIQ